MSLLNFPWPANRAGTQPPIWRGEAFEHNGERTSVISYGEASSHWTEELTSFHEAAAGCDHPIDIASRRLAVASMRRLRGRPGLCLLAAGCSSGFELDELRRALPEAGLIGADYIRGPLENLAARIPGVPLLQFDLRQCPLPDAAVDGVVCLNVLEHIDEDERALAHIHRILKPGGIAHIEVPAGPELYGIYDEFLLHHRRYRRRDLARLASAAGFKIEKMTHLGFFVYPAFWWVKRDDRRKLSLPATEKRRLVLEQVASTRRSRILAALFHLETAVQFLSLPTGIRCVAILRKR